MAEKMANSIGRELRYFEYKFRKKQSKGKNKKHKDTGPGPQLAWSDSTRSDDFSYQMKSEDMKKATPVNKGEEALQIQVALAMSREEEKERERQQESDDLRLEMAMKESVKNAAKPPQPQPSLLDLSMEKPAHVSAPVPTTNSLFDSATNDPWGNAAPSAPQTSFDPFAPSANQAPSSSMAANGFGMPNGGALPPSADMGAWGAEPALTTPSVQQDPWGGSPGFSAAATNPQVVSSTNPTSQTDMWGNTAFGAPAPAPTQPVYANVQNGGAWGNPDPFSSNQQPATFDPFSSSNLAAPATTANDPYSFSTQTTTSFETPPAFDPLKDFDTLRIGTEPSPVLLHKDFTASSSVAKDIFPMEQLLEPVPVSTKPNDGLVPETEEKKKVAQTDKFLGENSNLVNLNSWQTYQLPYVTKPLGTQSHNPFAQTGPQKTLNEMKGITQHPFAQSSFN